MKFAEFFVDRPIFAGVISLVVFVIGLISVFQLPVSEYPEVVPPSIVVRTAFPGATPKTLAETVASPLEDAINGVDNLLYMDSQSTNDGRLQLTVTFTIGTDVDIAQMQVQNRVAQALPRLPDEVRQQGVTTEKSSSDLTMVVHITSPNDRYDSLYLRNYAQLNIVDPLKRIPGVGSVLVFGSGEYAMRVWLDPDALVSRNLTTGEVIAAIREQNVQVAAGSLGQSPAPGADFQISVNTQGRLADISDFSNIIVKTGEDGALVRLADVARVELGANSYALRSLLDNKQAVAIPIFQAPGSNAISISDGVRAAMDSLKDVFPEGVDYTIVYDPTIFVRDSIKAVITTLLEAVALVVLVVIIFLQTWRASIIPLAAVPVSIVGTFAVMAITGFSINVLTLFGLVLAIGIVVDDAIVVVENVERNIREGLSPREATVVAMREVTGPIIATSLVLFAVFVPISFIPGLTGRFYQQFAFTIAVAVFISTINSLTLSPALSALLLKPEGAKQDIVTRLMHRLFGWFFVPFNRIFDSLKEKYAHGVALVIRRSFIVLVVFIGLLGLTGWQFKQVPSGYVPPQDKQYLIGFAQLPDGASIDRTEAVMARMSEISLKNPGVQNAVAFPGLSINGFTNATNAGIVFLPLKTFSERMAPDASGFAIAQQLMGEFSQIQEAFVAVFPPPPVRGLGTKGGFKIQIQDRANLGYNALHEATMALMMRAWQTPELTGVFGSFRANVPQIDALVNREKAKQHGLDLNDIYLALQTYLGSFYVNDFNKFGKTYQVIAQAEYADRLEIADIGRLKTRNQFGDMVPLSSVVELQYTNGPDRVMHYNGYPSADLSGAPAPGISSGQAQAIMTQLAEETLPAGISFEWTELAYQNQIAGNAALFIFPLVVLLVYMVLAAQYESLVLPLAVILIVPMTILSALFGVHWWGGDNNVFTQIALFVLVGLATKNAILIVEFAKGLEEAGWDTVAAAVESCRLRLRPILMTSLSFIMGVSPLAFAVGAGAEIRQALGVAVFWGMLGVTLFGLVLTPVFYVSLRKLFGGPVSKLSEKSQHDNPFSAPSAHVVNT